MISDEAVCRVFGVSKNSLYRWQERLSHLKPTQVLYALKRRQGLKIVTLPRNRPPVEIVD